MTFLQPAFLWGLLAVAIPIAIHLWHQKKGKPLPWAAMQWLQEASQQQQRGLKFDDWLLLALRCLLITLLSILLAQPVWQRSDDSKAIRPVHLTIADSLVTTSFRFELDQARQRGEAVVSLPSQGPVNPLQLQATIDSLRQPDIFLHLYISNDASLADVPMISVPERFSLHAATRPQALSPRSDQLNPKPFARVKNPLNVRLAYRNPLEQKTVTAALRALSTVYGLTLNILAPQSTTQPDWVLTDKQPPVSKTATSLPASTLYTVSGAVPSAQTVPNVTVTPDTLTPQTSERVANGQLPEWLGEQILRFYGLDSPPPALSDKELTGLFVRDNGLKTAQSASDRHTQEQKWLLLTLLIVIGVERWMALRK